MNLFESTCEFPFLDNNYFSNSDNKKGKQLKKMIFLLLVLFTGASNLCFRQEDGIKNKDLSEQV